MGMTIDESRQLLSQYQKLFNSLNGDYKLSQVQISELSHSISTALDTIRKIEQILKDIPYGGEVTVRRIQEVVEDGNDD